MSCLIHFSTYASKVYDTILQYHATTGRHDRALDLGCGPGKRSYWDAWIWLRAGFVAINLASKFKQVIGLDPSSKMVEVGIQPDAPASRVDYRVGNAEDLSGAGIEEQSVDLVVAGMTCRTSPFG